MNSLFCTKCKTSFSMDEARWRCKCGSVLDIQFKSSFDLEKIKKRRFSIWRYRDALPIKDDVNIISFDEGFTPLIELNFNGRSVLIKQDQLFPSGSFKDRGASILISKVKELGIKDVVLDSSGNAAASIASYCAKAGINCNIFVPEGTSDGKLAQIRSLGAKLNKVRGTREDTARAVLDIADKIYYASHYWNSFFFHGTKTFAFEVCEQLCWRSPDVIVLPVGNGSLLLGAYIGFCELFSAKIIDKTPRIIAVQSKNCAPLYRAFKRDLTEIPVKSRKENLAEGIAIADPVRGKQILEAVTKSNGDFIVVSENEIKQSLKEMFQMGYYIEPTSAAAIAGVKKYLQRSSFNEVIVSIFTGHGLKSTEKILEILHD